MKSQRYKCPVCGETFKKANQVEKHVRKEHGFDVAAKNCENQNAKENCK